jgi:4-amino-4-deoxy-L-arabinose transferase-like glycosyltransferase
MIEPDAATPREGASPRQLAAVAAAVLVGLVLMADGLGRSSATYDEVAYLRVAARWWRTGDQEVISRMGSPLTFWKLQQAPTLWLLDRLGRAGWIDDPIAHQAELLPALRLGTLWIWAVAAGLTALWARRLFGPNAMVMATWMFALGPNLLAHGPLLTMEMPMTAASAGVLLLFWRWIETGERKWFWMSAAACGLAFSLKFTAVVLPPLLGLAWWDALRRRGVGVLASGRVVAGRMAGFVALMLAVDLLVTGFAAIPPSESVGPHPTIDGHWPASLGRLLETPWPQDWVAFAIQARHQRSGGPSYLLGERRVDGWWSYYLVALAVKVPLGAWLIALARWWFGRRVDPSARGRFATIVALGFLGLASLGSGRNYGVRYLLPVAPAAIVWASALAEGPRRGRLAAWIGLAGMAAAVASSHPHEVTYFNVLAGGTEGGRRVLSDSNLDWGQGARALARLQAERPEMRDLTLYYFGDTDPTYYGVIGKVYVVDAGTNHPGLPSRLAAWTRYLGVSASLQFGPWGPEGYFRDLDGVHPVAWTDDGTIAVYRTADLPGSTGGISGSSSAAGGLR